MMHPPSFKNWGSDCGNSDLVRDVVYLALRQPSGRFQALLQANEISDANLAAKLIERRTGYNYHIAFFFTEVILACHLAARDEADRG